MTTGEYVERWLLVLAGVAVGGEAILLLQKYLWHMF